MKTTRVCFLNPAVSLYNTYKLSMLDIFLFLEPLKYKHNLFACVLSYKVQNEKQRKKPTTNRKHGWLLHTFLETLCATYAWDYGANPGSSHTQQCACGDSSSTLKKPSQKGHLGWTSPGASALRLGGRHMVSGMRGFRPTTTTSATVTVPNINLTTTKSKEKDTERTGKWFKKGRTCVCTLRVICTPA